MRLPWSKPISKKEPVTIDLDALKAKYRTTSTSADTMEFEPIKLERRDPTERSRKILGATAVRNMHNVKECLKIRLIYQRKHNKGTVPEGKEFENLERIKLSSLAGGQEVQVDLDAAQTAQLAEHLQNLYAIASEGITFGSSEKVVFSAEDSAFLEHLEAAVKGSRERRDQVLAMLRDLDPAAFDVAAHKARHEQHQAALEEFEMHLRDYDWNEGEWETFFARNRWVFGHGLSYQFLSEVQSQPHYGGVDATGKGGQLGDHLMATEANVRFTVLVEVKTPQAPLTQRKEYRNGAFVVGDDVAGGVAQLQANARKWTLDGAQREENRKLEQRQIFTVQPKGILVVGSTAFLDCREKRVSFELYRRNLTNPEILTFDELYERAKFIVQHDLESTEAGIG